MKRFIDNMMKQVLKKNASNSESTLIDGVVTTNKLGNKSVTDKKIADDTITLDNLSSEVKAKLNS